MHKAGFVNIIGNPNVGKSTLMNCLVGENLSIITPKAQTTRHRIFGILNSEKYQIVLSDTPGIIKPSYELQRSMMKFIKDSFKDADIILLMVEPQQRSIKDEIILKKIKLIELPVLILINKIDISNQNEIEQDVDFWKNEISNSEVLPISALNNFNIDLLLNKLISFLPKSPAYFPKDAVTDKPKRFFVSEIIREKILLNYKEEIPYAVEVIVESFKDEKDIIKIETIINVERESQKGIVIGHKGKGLTRIGKEARKELEKFFVKKIFLKLFVKVEKNWRKNTNQLKRFGYKN